MKLPSLPEQPKNPHRPDDVLPSPISSIDTLLIAGGSADGLEALSRSEPFMKWIKQMVQRTRRYGSVCTGAFVLGHLGLLKKKKVATHWGSCQKLAILYPEAEVDANALFVNQGKLWTSAGVTTGIDMSLEMVAQDLGAEIANIIAKRLVLYVKRPGYQSQFSPLLKAQANAEPQFLKLIEWLRGILIKILTFQGWRSKWPCQKEHFIASSRNALEKRLGIMSKSYD